MNESAFLTRVVGVSKIQETNEIRKFKPKNMFENVKVIMKHGQKRTKKEAKRDQN